MSKRGLKKIQKGEKIMKKLLAIMLSAVILHETLTWQTVTGGLLIVAGTFVLLL